MPTDAAYTDIKDIRNFKSLIKYLRQQLGWPVDEDQADDLTFDYTPQELDLDEVHAVKIREIKQLRPLADGQPWGIFWIDFEPKRLPVVVMRRILSRLVTRKRATEKTKQATWNLRDLMFVSATGEGNQRGISFAHFRDAERPGGQPQLRTFSWDVNENHLYYLANLNLEALRWPKNERDIEGWQAQWAAAFTSGHREVIQTAKDLASRMAQLAAGTRAAVNDVYAYERATGPLRKLYGTFKRVLIHDLTIDDFADMYAQTVTYGLFSARVTRSGKFKLDNVSALIPNTNPFLRELLEECLKVGAGGKRQIDLDELGVGELVETLQAADMEAVMYDFGRQSRDHKEDPVIHFYQSFLREYDADKQLKRGVIYTPDPVVQFIVRSIDYLLRSRFECPDGVADTGTLQWQGQTYPKVLMLDPAVGTGTFDEYMIRVIHETFQHNHRALKPADRQAKWNEYVAEHLLPRLYGFELMMAPYAVAHMKLGLVLKETGYDFNSAERLHIYLTNTLQPTDEVPRVDVPFLAHEAEKAHEAKEHLPVTVVYGNPPYANFGMMNKGPWILGLLNDYKQGLNERKLNLDDDFIKFMRFAQWKIEQSGQGILAFITNNTYIDGITHRRMRESLMETFNEIYIFDLHGSIRKGESDENVFDIQQGVCISILIRHGDTRSKTRVFHGELRGSRSDKYTFLGNNDLSAVDWRQLKPVAPYFFFVPKSFDNKKEYYDGWNMNDVFCERQSGVKTDRDELFFDDNREALLARIKTFYSSQGLADQFRTEYRIENSSSYDLLSRRQRTSFDAVNLRKCMYRPFDQKWLYYSPHLVSRPAWDIMRHMLAGWNVALLAKRQSKREPFSYIWCAQNLIESSVFESAYANNSIYPLYLYPEVAASKQSQMFSDQVNAGGGGRRPNLTPNFIADVEKRLGLKFVTDGVGDVGANPGGRPGGQAQGRAPTTVGPEDIFHYIYAVFHSPTYRLRYAEFLKIDFPRVPLTGDLDLFRTLAKYGQELVALHLMESPKLNKAITKYTGKGDDVVASGYPAYEDETVWINDTQGFKGVPEDVWEFHIGGYQVCHKWLKDRRGRTLSDEDKTHYARIVVALRETMRLMAEIDAAIPAWPIT